MNIVGEGAIVTGVLPDVFPVINTENLATDGWALAGWRPAMGGANITGAAGQQPHIQISNPGGSGIITVVEVMIIGSNTAGRVEGNVHDAILTTLEVSPRWRDRRFATLNRPVTQVREQSIVGTPIVSPMVFADLTASISMNLQPPQGFLVLVPGTSVAFAHQANAARLAITFFWRERAVEPAELNI